MKTSSTWNYKTIVGRIMMGLVLTIMIGSMDVGPALAHDGHNRWRDYDHDRYEHRGRWYDHGRYEYRGRGYDHGRYGYRGYGPPPVIYAPPPPLGIGIFFPPIFFHP
jgi:hypothetical protein